MNEKTMLPEKHTSQKQIDANRRNAEKSTGPKSEEGKARVALNALRHGLTGQVTLMTPEDREEHELHLNEYLAMYKPANFVERDLVFAIAGDAWRLKLSRTHEQNLYAIGHMRNSEIAERMAPGSDPQNPQVVAAVSASKTYFDESLEFQRLTLYEQRIKRSMRNNIVDLKAMQAERIKAHREALKAAALFAQLCHAEGKPYNPAEDPARLTHDVVFTPAEINLHLKMERLNDKMRHHNATGWNLEDGYKQKHPPIVEDVFTPIVQ